MASKKRSFDEVLPEPAGSLSSPSGYSKSLEDTSSNGVPSAKRPKITEEAHERTVLENALSCLIVEPCDSTLTGENVKNMMFKPMVGREAEYELIEAHYKESFENHQPRPLFICGAPGCGKSAMIHKIMTSLISSDIENVEKSQLAPYTVRINCGTDLSSTKPSLLYLLIASRLIASYNDSLISEKLNKKLEMPNSTEMSESQKLQFVLSNLNKYHLLLSNQTQNTKPLFITVLLDEVDHILSSKTSFSKELHFLFSSWLEPWNIMSIICISNDRDLFDRSLPLLSMFTSKSGDQNIKTLQFKPYTIEQLERILYSRVGGQQVLPTTQASLSNPQLQTTTQIFDVKAAKFLCAKISKLAGDQSGDVRVLVDLAKSCLLEAIAKGKLLVTLDIVVSVWKNKMTSQIPSDPIAPLPLVQKCALLSYLLAMKLNRSAQTIRPNALEAAWKSVSKQAFISSPPDLSEMWRAIELLESIGHIQIINEKGNRKSYKLQNVATIEKSLSQDPVLGLLLQ